MWAWSFARKMRSLPVILRASLLPMMLALLAVTTVQNTAHAQGTQREYPENSTAPVATFSVADEEGTVVAWSLTGIDGGDLSVDDGVVGFRRPPDHEFPTDYDLDNVYEFTVNVTDGTNTTSAHMTVTVTNVEEDGVVALSSLQPEVDVPLLVTLADLDGGLSDVTWLWDSSADGATGWAPITGAESDSYTPVAADVGNHLRVTASYTDGEGTGKSASSTSMYAVRESHPQGHGPEFPEGESGMRSVPENTEAGTDIGVAISAVDEEGHVLTYTLSGVDAVAFDLVRSSGQMVTSAHLDHELRDSYSMTLTASDPTNAHDSITVSVNVTNVDEEGIITLSTPQPLVDEELRTYLDDPDGDVTGVSWTWERSPGRTVWTAIDGAASGTYVPDDEDEGSYLRITASYTDGEGSGKTTQAVSLNPVHELETNHAPTFPPTETGVRMVPENTPPGEPIGDPFTAIDDHDHALTYSQEGNDAGSFDIDVSTGQLFTRAPLDHEVKSLYSVVVTVHDGEDAHGDPDHSRDASLAAIIIVTDVDEGLPSGICVDGGAVENSEDNAELASNCETLLSVRDELAGDAVLNWSADVSISGWNGVSLGRTPQRIVGLDLHAHGLDGVIQPTFGRLSGLETLDLSGNMLTGQIPSELGILPNLRELRLSGNLFDGCVPGDLRRVPANDLTDLDIPHCDVLLRGLAIVPGELNQQFDPYRSNYTAVSDTPRVTVSPYVAPGLIPVHEFLDNLSRPQPDADVRTPGHQVDLNAGATFVRVRVVSADLEAERTYTVLLADGDLFRRYDSNENRVIDRAEVLKAVRDYFDGNIGRDEVIGMIQLFFFP